MKPFLFRALMVLPVLYAARTTAAEPAWGANCLSCHGQWQTSAVRVIGHDTLADPNESATGAPDRGVLKVFETYRGRVKSLTAEVVGLVDGDTYAVELKRLRFAGVEAGGHLSYAADCNWPEWGESAAYYTQPVIAYGWGTGPSTFRFDITVQPDAGYDYYDLVFAVAGRFSAEDELFYAEEHFYLRVRPLIGDLNCDGVINFADINPFVVALAGQAAYQAQYPNCRWLNADCNGDGQVNFGDINAFVTLLDG